MELKEFYKLAEKALSEISFIFFEENNYKDFKRSIYRRESFSGFDEYHFDIYLDNRKSITTIIPQVSKYLILDNEEVLFNGQMVGSLLNRDTRYESGIVMKNRFILKCVDDIRKTDFWFEQYQSYENFRKYLEAGELNIGSIGNSGIANKINDWLLIQEGE